MDGLPTVRKRAEHYQPLKLVLERQGHIPWLGVGKLGVEAYLTVIGFIEQVVDI